MFTVGMQVHVNARGMKDAKGLPLPHGTVCRVTKVYYERHTFGVRKTVDLADIHGNEWSKIPTAAINVVTTPRLNDGSRRRL